MLSSRPARSLAALVTATASAAGMTLAAPAPSEAAPQNNNQIAYRYLVGKGLTKHQAAGVVGNLMQESGSPINPRARQKNGPGMGIAQWSRGARWNHLLRYAKSTHRSPYALNTQLDFLWIELNGSEKRALKKLRTTGTVHTAAVSFATNFERCAPRYCANNTRARYGTQVLKAYAA